MTLDTKSRPDTPESLQVVNVTHDSVHLAWAPGFHGGMDQYFRVKYTVHEEHRMYETTKIHEVYPANVASTVLSDLKPGRQYSFAIMALNNLGESNYTSDPVIVRTSSKSNFPSRSRHFNSEE